MWIRLLPIAFVSAAAVAASAQMLPSADAAGAGGAQQPYQIETYGAFRMLVLAGDFSPKVSLAAAMAKHPTTGVGAIADARGEVTIRDGRLIVSYGRQGEQPRPEDQSAALLTIGTVPAWQEITIEQDVAPADIEAFLSATAARHGVNPDGPFPFQVRGTLGPFAMHVNAAPTDGPHGMGQPIAITVETKGDTLVGQVAGFYVSSDLVGVVSHGGTRTHSHWVAPDDRSTAHLDSWGLKGGSVLLLPKP